MTNSPKIHHVDYAVVGSGIAGLRAAIELSAAGNVLVLAKSHLSDSATAWVSNSLQAAVGQWMRIDFDHPVTNAAITLESGTGKSYYRPVGRRMSVD